MLKVYECSFETKGNSYEKVYCVSASLAAATAVVEREFPDKQIRFASCAGDVVLDGEEVRIVLAE